MTEPKKIEPALKPGWLKDDMERASRQVALWKIVKYEPPKIAAWNAAQEEKK